MPVYGQESNGKFFLVEAVLLPAESENEPQQQRQEYISSMLGEEVSSIMHNQPCVST